MAKGNGNKGRNLLAFIFCVPLAFILYFWISYSSQSITLENVRAVKVSSPDEVKLTLESQSDIDFYVNMLTKSVSINTAMRDVSGETPVYIVCEREDKSIEYKLYPSLNLSGCLLVGPEGKLYVLETDTAKSLLLRPEYEYLYSTHFLPELSIISGEESFKVNPLSCEWEYIKSDGKSYKYTPDTFATGDETYTIIKGRENLLSFAKSSALGGFELLDVSFVAENGNSYNITDISEIDLSVDTLLTITYTAKWNATGGAKAYGNASYKFNILYDVPAMIELPVKEYQPGDVIVFYANHLNSDETVDFKSDLTDKELVFSHETADKGVALLPIPYGTAAGEYEMEINGVKETITVLPRTDREWAPIFADEAQYEEYLTPEKMQLLADTLATVTETRPDIDYFGFGEENLYSPVGNKTPTYVYGQTVNVGGKDATGDTGDRLVQGVTYALDAGTSVRSAQAGVVVYVGNIAPTGNTVVVYHGYGIYTYYYHLDTVNVSVGTTLIDGEILGTAGSTGFTNGKTALHFAVSIDGVFVDPLLFD